MAVRNCRDIGENLQKIVTRLMANNTLVKLLYYNDPDPLNKEDLTEEEKKTEIFNKLIRIVPKVTTHETTQSIVAIRVPSGVRIASNKEFRVITVSIEVFVPWDQWIFRNSNLRPFAILGEIQDSLEGKTINGLGKIEGGDFVLTTVTDEVAGYEQTFRITTYD